jgi:hypothetical protein
MAEKKYGFLKNVASSEDGTSDIIRTYFTMEMKEKPHFHGWCIHDTIEVVALFSTILTIVVLLNYIRRCYFRYKAGQ